MLEEVGIEFLVVEGEVRLDVVVEFDDVELDAFFLEQRLGCFENLACGTAVAPTLSVFVPLV